MGSMSLVHWGLVLLVVMLVFGTRKLANIGADLGSAVKGFKDGVKSDEAPAQPQVALVPVNRTPSLAGEVKQQA